MAREPGLFIVLYTDEDVTSELAPAIRARGLDAQSAFEAGLLNADDSMHLAFASERGMSVLSHNARDYIRLARQYARTGRRHSGIILSSEQYSRRRFGEFLRLVLRLMNSLTADEMRDRVVYLQQFR